MGINIYLMSTLKGKAVILPYIRLLGLVTSLLLFSPIKKRKPLPLVIGASRQGGVYVSFSTLKLERS